MKKILLLVFMALPFVFTSCSDGDDKQIYKIFCGAKEINKKIGCDFYFFEPGEYISVEKNDEDIHSPNYQHGLAIATKRDGTKVKCIGHAYYSALEVTYGAAQYLNNKGSLEDSFLTQGTYYVVCIPIGAGTGRYPYKAKIFTKEKNEVLYIEPVFTKKSYTAEIGEYKYYEWDE